MRLFQIVTDTCYRIVFCKDNKYFLICFFFAKNFLIGMFAVMANSEHWQTMGGRFLPLRPWHKPDG